MSGLCGSVRPVGDAASPTALEGALAALAHRGTQASSWLDDGVALGQRCATALRRDPLRELVIVADARLDDRATLARRLGVSDQLYDAELIMRAYAAWQDRCVEHLLGDFAFALWDGRAQRLFCARDPFGVKPFYYQAGPDGAFTFASEIKAIRQLTGQPLRLNEGRVADHLIGEFHPTSTFYAGVVRLQPAHCLIFDTSGLRTRQYWTLDAGPELRLASDEAYAEAFLDVFQRAVRDRLAGPEPCGAMLSGGLDSSSIVATSRTLTDAAQLPTFSIVFDTVQECDERTFQAAVVARGGLQPHTLVGDRIGPLADAKRMLSHLEEPPFGPGMATTWALSGLAREQGVGALLNGHGGDETVSHGYGRLIELALGHRWFSLARELRGVARVCGDSYWDLLGSYVSYALDPRLCTSGWQRRAARLGRTVARRVPRTAHRQAHRQPLTLIGREFADRCAVAQQNTASTETVGPVRSEREFQLRTLTNPVQVAAFELLDKTAAAFGVEARYPFWDRRLVEFCLSLPAEQKLRGGWTRLVLRHAMAKYLPDTVRWRPDKNNFLPNLRHGLQTFERARIQALGQGEARAITAYADMDVVRGLCNRVLACERVPDASDVGALWRVLSLASWLEETEICA